MYRVHCVSDAARQVYAVMYARNVPLIILLLAIFLVSVLYTTLWNVDLIKVLSSYGLHIFDQIRSKYFGMGTSYNINHINSL